MRRISCLAVLLAVVLAGCGGDSAPEASSPLDEALGYLPKNAPLVVTFETDLEGEQAKNVDRILDKFPAVGSLEDSLKGLITSGDLDFDKDLKPLLGNQFVVGATQPQSIIDNSDDNDFIGAVEAKDGDKLKDLVDRQKLKEEGEKSGAKLYKDEGGDLFAVKGDVLIVAGSRKLLEDALAQREKDDRLDEKTFNKALGDLPKAALLRVYGDLQTLIAQDPDTKDARKVEWVDALKTFGLTASAKGDEIAVDYNLSTAGGLTEEDLPLAAGSEAPSVLRGKGELGFGLRGLDQIFKFGEAAGQAVDPSGYGDYTAAKKTIEDQLKIDIDKDIVEQLSGEISGSVDIDGNYGLRADLADPAAFKQTLKKLEPTGQDLAESLGAGSRFVKPKGDGLYRIEPASGDPVAFGVVSDKLVVANDAAKAKAAATAQAEPVSGAEGAVVFAVNAEELTDAVLEQIGGTIALGGLVTGPLGDLIGSTRVEPDGLSGSFTLGFD